MLRVFPSARNEEWKRKRKLLFRAKAVGHGKESVNCDTLGGFITGSLKMSPS